MAIVALTVLVSCEKQERIQTRSSESPDTADSERTVFCSIDVNIGEERVGIELNGKKARLQINPYSKERQCLEISYHQGLRVLEQFYSISNVEEHRGDPSDDRQESTQFIVNLHDEMRQRHSQDWVDYIYSKDKSDSNREFSDWLASVESLKVQTELGGGGKGE